MKQIHWNSIKYDNLNESIIFSRHCMDFQGDGVDNNIIIININYTCN